MARRGASRTPLVLVVGNGADPTHTPFAGLEAFGFRMETLVEGEVGRVADRLPDVVVIGVSLQEDVALAVRRIRRSTDVPILVVSAADHDPTKIRAFKAGAEDCVTEPFSMEELAARIRVALRRVDQPARRTIKTVGDISIDVSRRTVKARGTEVHLTPIEFDLLKHLAANSGRVLTHGDLLERIWGAEHREEVPYLRPVIAALRKKLGPHVIRTEPCVGYRLNIDAVDPEDPAPRANPLVKRQNAPQRIPNGSLPRSQRSVDSPPTIS